MDALLNCEWDNVRSWSLFFLARSHVVHWFLFCLSRVLSYVYPLFLTCEFTAVLPSCTVLFIPAFSINIIQITTMIQTPHQSTHIQWRPQPQTNKDRFITGNINLYFNTLKLKSIYWQTISYNKICSCLSVYYYVKSQLVRQPAASNVNMILLPSSVSSIVHN